MLKITCSKLVKKRYIVKKCVISGLSFGRGGGGLLKITCNKLVKKRYIVKKCYFWSVFWKGGWGVAEDNMQ